MPTLEDVGTLDMTKYETGWHTEPPCEGPAHPAGLYGHVPVQSASWSVSAPCGVMYLTCDGYAQGILQNSGDYTFSCEGPGGCFNVHKLKDLHWRKL